MRKIPTLFKRDPDNLARVLPEVHPDCQWVIDGEGVPTLKLDGMCCAIVNGVFVKRREVKKGQPDPYGFIQTDNDEVTGKRVGWVEVGNGAEDKYFREAFDRLEDQTSDRTFELVGPKSQGGVEGFEQHALVEHRSLAEWTEESHLCPRTFDELNEWLEGKDIEGIVWHHEDGRMAKIKGKDFGHKRVKGAVELAPYAP